MSCSLFGDHGSLLPRVEATAVSLDFWTKQLGLGRSVRVVYVNTDTFQVLVVGQPGLRRIFPPKQDVVLHRRRDRGRRLAIVLPAARPFLIDSHSLLRRLATQFGLLPVLRVSVFDRCYGGVRDR